MRFQDLRVECETCDRIVDDLFHVTVFIARAALCVRLGKRLSKTINTASLASQGLARETKTHM